MRTVTMVYTARIHALLTHQWSLNKQMYRCYITESPSVFIINVPVTKCIPTLTFNFQVEWCCQVVYFVLNTSVTFLSTLGILLGTTASHIKSSFSINICLRKQTSKSLFASLATATLHQTRRVSRFICGCRFWITIHLQGGSLKEQSV